MIVKITNNILSKDGEDIGKIEGNVCSLLRAVGPTVKSAASAAHGSKLSFTVLGADEGAGADEGEDEGSTSSSTDNMAAQFIGDVQAAIVSHGPGILEGNAGPKPARDPINGDKCPLLVAWKAAQKGGK